MRTRTEWDLLSGQTVALIILGGCFLAGGAAGALFAGLADGEGAQMLYQYLTDYLALAAEGELERPFWQLLWEQLRYFLAAVLLGVSAVGIIGLPILFSVRGFLFAVSSSCFFRTFGGAGMVPALILFGLPALLWTPGLFLAGSAGLSNAWGMLHPASRREGHTAPAYWPRIALCALFFLSCSITEYVIIPVLLQAAAQAFA